MRRIRLLAVVVAAAWLLGGCFRYESVMTVEEDGSGRLRELLVVSRTAVAAALGEEAVASHVPRAERLDLPSWVQVRNHSNGDYEGVVLDVAFSGPAQFAERVDTLHRLLAERSGSIATSTVRLERRNGGWDFSMQTTDLAAVPALGLGGSSGGGSGAATGTFDRLYGRGELVVVLRLPGAVVDHNADAFVDGQLIWRVSAQATRTSFYARTGNGGALSGTVNATPLLQAAAATATLGGLIVFVVIGISRRRCADRDEGRAEHRRRRLQLGEVLPDDPGPPSGWPSVPPPHPPSERRAGPEGPPPEF